MTCPSCVWDDLKLIDVSCLLGDRTVEEQETNHNLGKKKRNKKDKQLVYSWREKESKAKTQNRNEEEQSAEKLGEAMWEGRKETCLEII